MEYLRLLSPCPPRSIYETAFCPALTFPDSLEVPPSLYLRFNSLFVSSDFPIMSQKELFVKVFI